MTTIYSKVIKRKFYSMMVLGAIYLILGVLPWLAEDGSYPISSFAYIPLGIIGVSYNFYLLKTNKLRNTISWNDDEITLKGIHSKPIIYKIDNIKTLSITDSNIIINSGLGDGEMLEIIDFKESDIQLLKSTFGEFTTQKRAVA